MTLDRHLLTESARTGLSLAPHDPIIWLCHFRVELRKGDWAYRDILKGLAPKPFEIAEYTGNLLTTAGAGNLWLGLTGGTVTNGAYNATNGAIAIGDGTTAAAAGDTDIAGTTTSIGNTTALSSTSTVMTYTIANSLLAGQVVVVTGAAPAGYNGTFVVASATSSAFTVTSTANPGAGTTQGAVSSVNKFRQLVNAAPTLSTNQAQFVSVFATANANYAWNCWGIVNSGSAQSGGTLLNHAVPASSLLTKTSAASATATMTLSLS